LVSAAAIPLSGVVFAKPMAPDPTTTAAGIASAALVPATNPCQAKPPKPEPPLSQYWNREDAKAALLRDLKRKSMIVMTGGPSCGKTALIEATLMNDPDIFCIRIDMRGIDLSRGDLYTQRQLCAALETSWDRFRSLVERCAGTTGYAANVAASAPGPAGSFASVVSAFAKLIEDFNKKGEVVNALGAAIDAVQQVPGKTTVIWFDEINELQSRGNPKHEWKDELFDQLSKLAVKVSKQEKKAHVLMVSSDQQYVATLAQVTQKGFGDVITLGYPTDEEADSFLATPLKNLPPVTDATTRKKIIDVCGGQLQCLSQERLSLDDSSLNNRILQAKRAGEDRRRQLRAAGVEGEAAWKLLREIAPALLKEGYVPLSTVEEKCDLAVFHLMLKNNLIGLRYAGSPAAFATDLPAKARQLQVVVPFHPLDRHWLKELSQKKE
jgi:hypothetical protein